jgi:hypothetical protein
MTHKAQTPTTGSLDQKTKMTSICASTPFLQLRLYEEWDDEDDRRCKVPLAAFLAGTQDPIEVAQAINTYIRTETSARLQALNDYAATHTLNPEVRESGEWMDLYPPNAGAFAQGFIWDWCRVSTAFPPHGEGQDRLISILDKIERMPLWMAPETHPDENGEVLTSELWRLGRHWIGLEDEFWRHNDDQYYILSTCWKSAIEKRADLIGRRWAFHAHCRVLCPLGQLSVHHGSSIRKGHDLLCTFHSSYSTCHTIRADP